MGEVKAFQQKALSSSSGDNRSEQLFQSYRIGAHHLINTAALSNELCGFWAEDVWDMRNNPTGRSPRGKDSYRFLKFTCVNRALNTELKFVCYRKFNERAWSPRTNAIPQQIHKIVRFFNRKELKVKSLLDYPVEKWEMMLRNYLIEEDEYFVQTVETIDKDQSLSVRVRSSRCLEILRVIYRELELVYDTRPEFERDIWNAERMGASVNLARSETTLNFTNVHPDWLRTAAKKYLRTYISSRSVTSAATIINVVTKFSVFLSEKHPALQPDQIERGLMLEYVNYLALSGLTQNVRREYLKTLNTFLEYCAVESWLPITEKRLIMRHDLPQLIKRKPRFISEYVMGQLESLLPVMPDSLRRMVLILKECGMRISELCTMRIDCLSKDGDGDYFLLYFRSKTSKEHSIPISKDVADAVIEQRNEAAARSYGIKSDYLFPRSNGKPYKCKMFGRLLNEFALEHKIANEVGKLWRFQAHQFRHTVGTRMINGGVSQMFVQKFLGHESPEMTAVYAQIHDKTLKNAFDVYLQQRGSLFGISGNSESRSQPEITDSGDSKINKVAGENAADADLLWFKKNVQAQILPNGYCQLPAAQAPCPHASACLTCASFRTDASFLPQHREQLAATKRLVQISRERGWQRQAEMNERVEVNLIKIIGRIESEDPVNNSDKTMPQKID